MADSKHGFESRWGHHSDTPEVFILAAPVVPHWPKFSPAAPLGSRGSCSRFKLLTAPAGVNGSVMPQLFAASMELVIWEAFGNTAAIR